MQNEETAGERRRPWQPRRSRTSPTLDRLKSHGAQRERLLIDLREEDESHAQGRITDSVRAAHGMMEPWADTRSPQHSSEIDPERRPTLYCSSGAGSANERGQINQRKDDTRAARQARDDDT